MYLEFQCAYHSCTHIPYITFRHMHTHAQSNSTTFAVNERLVIIYVWFHSAPIQLLYFSVSFANRMKGPRETHDNSSHSALALTEQCAVVSGVNCDWRPAPHPPAGSSDFLSLLCQCCDFDSAKSQHHPSPYLLPVWKINVFNFTYMESWIKTVLPETSTSVPLCFALTNCEKQCTLFFFKLQDNI